MINLGNIKNEKYVRKILLKKFLGMLRIEPGAAGLEVQTLPLCYATPRNDVSLRGVTRLGAHGVSEDFFSFEAPM